MDQKLKTKHKKNEPVILESQFVPENQIKKDMLVTDFLKLLLNVCVLSVALGMRVTND